MAAVINYTPPLTVSRFIKDFLPGELFYDWIIGPYGSGKTTGNFFKLLYMAKLQQPGPDGIRRTRAVVVRNTGQQLIDTTLKSWFLWFKHGQAGHWHATDKTFVLRFDDVECEVLFRPLDTPQDVARVLSLEVTFAILDEYVEIPQPIVEALSGRCGRYPSSIMGGPTNWGMWGASNPSTEDNWWFDHLHNSETVIQPGEGVSLHHRIVFDERNARYFLQPSGFSDNAENVEHLPGKQKYYLDLAKNKTDAWKTIYIEAEWGQSIAGKPVISSFNPKVHLSKPRLNFDKRLTLVGGYDPGIAGTAMIFGQEDEGRLFVLGELTANGLGAGRFMRDRVAPYLSRMFPDLPDNGFLIEADPSSTNRSANDETTVIQTVKRHYPVTSETNPRLPLRVDAIDYFATRMVFGLPALVIDEQACPILIRALKGGWRYKIDRNASTDHIKDPKPEKNHFSHPGDGFGYLCRHFHRQAVKNERYSGSGVSKFVPPRTFSPGYHHR